MHHGTNTLSFLHNTLFCVCLLQTFSLEEELSADPEEDLEPEVKTPNWHTIVGEPEESGTEHNTNLKASHVMEKDLPHCDLCEKIHNPCVNIKHLPQSRKNNFRFKHISNSKYL